MNRLTCTMYGMYLQCTLATILTSVCRYLFTFALSACCARGITNTIRWSYQNLYAVHIPGGMRQYHRMQY